MKRVRNELPEKPLGSGCKLSNQTLLSQGLPGRRSSRVFLLSVYGGGGVGRRIRTQQTRPQKNSIPTQQEERHSTTPKNRQQKPNEKTLIFSFFILHCLKTPTFPPAPVRSHGFPTPVRVGSYDPQEISRDQAMDVDKTLQVN
jgi:hypothetical protein